MNNKLNIYLNKFLKNKVGASEDSISKLQSQLNFSLPSDYIEIMKEFNGGDGRVGNGGLCLFPIDDLIMINNNYGFLMEQIPDYFLFAKDAAETGYAFHKYKGTIHSFGLFSNFETDPIEFCGNSFEEFIEYLYNE